MNSDTDSRMTNLENGMVIDFTLWAFSYKELKERLDLGVLTKEERKETEDEIQRRTIEKIREATTNTSKVVTSVTSSMYRVTRTI